MTDEENTSGEAADFNEKATIRAHYLMPIFLRNKENQAMSRTHQANHVQGRTLTLICILALVLATMVCATKAEAFCVYNKSDTTIGVSQIKGYSSWGKRVDWSIRPGENKCCNYKTKDCNKSQEKTAKVAFEVRYLGKANCSMGGCSQIPLLACKKEIKAGGWLTIKGKSPDFSCRPHY